jgi:hypothetical protein
VYVAATTELLARSWLKALNTKLEGAIEVPDRACVIVTAVPPVGVAAQTQVVK